MYYLMAQAAEAPLPAWGTLTVSGVMLGLLTWLIMKGFPSVIDKIEKLIENFTSQIATARSDAEESQTKAMAWHERQVDKCLAHCTEERKVYRESLHAVRNAASQKLSDHGT